MWNLVVSKKYFTFAPRFFKVMITFARRILLKLTSKPMSELMFKNLRYDSLDVANAIRYAAQQRGLSVNMTQINKLLYITYGVMLVVNREQITDEIPSAWPYGPVFPNVHRKLKLYSEITPDTYNRFERENPHLISIINQVIDAFRGYSAGQLSEWSHQKGSPWDYAVQRTNGKWNSKLSNEDIFNYFFTAVKISWQ
jgi:uncharacterized phage-associated protein